MPPRPTSQKPSRAPLARYTNYFEVGHNPYEFLVDFGQYQPEAGNIVLHTRIALGPSHAKLMHEMLARAIHDYEAGNGAIAELPDVTDPPAVMLRSLPDFERRAVDARRQAADAPPKPGPHRSTSKR
jgi:hypothetical protein